ncbi:hypothetical protein C8A03DRAFT_14248 [Achaetomium macrosporum]|uniref:Uncharacterized protein n=1 Tax=Achaetomium macrosporum TaxID=79813 RepID=A0AAN7CD50_9PEZI|nr:hypothetical protein C8A03DRAFT_14248 [Achaetomium macrosporum]
MEVIEGFSDLSTKALSVIRAARLPHPKGVLVESFVTEAADPDRAAQHLLNRIAPENEGSDVAACLDSFCSDWRQVIANFVHEGPVRPLRDRRCVPIITRRDGGTCRFSGLGDSWRDRLAVYPILPPFGTGKIEIDSVGQPGRTRPALPSPGCRGPGGGANLALVASQSLHELLVAFLGPDLSGWVLSGCEDPCAPFGSHWLLRTSAASAFAQGFWKLFVRPLGRYEVSTCRNVSVVMS